MFLGWELVLTPTKKEAEHPSSTEMVGLGRQDGTDGQQARSEENWESSLVTIPTADSQSSTALYGLCL